MQTDGILDRDAFRSDEWVGGFAPSSQATDSRRDSVPVAGKRKFDGGIETVGNDRDPILGSDLLQDGRRQDHDAARRLQGCNQYDVQGTIRSVDCGNLASLTLFGELKIAGLQVGQRALIQRHGNIYSYTPDGNTGERALLRQADPAGSRAKE
jgi:hypothetical protein